MKEYQIEVKAWMLKESTGDFDFMQKFNRNIPMPLMVMFTGGKIDETAKMIKVWLHGDIKQRTITRCMGCGRPITNKISQYFGLGPICGEHNYVNPFDTEDELNEAISNFRTKLVNTTWVGWLPISAITAIDDVTDPMEIRNIIEDMPIEIFDDISEDTSADSRDSDKFIINVKVDKPILGTDDFSAFVSCGYNKQVVDTIKGIRKDARRYNPDTKVWEIAYSELGNLMANLPDCKFHIENEDIVPDKVELPADVEFKTVPMHHQVEGVEYGLSHSRWLLADEQGLGKALSLDTKIYTPTGFKLMKDIKVGDYVFGKNGKPTQVLAVYDHKNVEMYRITFSDGVIIDCCKDHLWEIHDQHGTKVVDTAWFLRKDQFGKIRKDNLFSGGAYKYWISRCDPVMFESQPIPIAPYVVGVLLGDGGISGNTVSFTSTDPEIVDYINSQLPSGYILHSTPSMEDFTYNIISTNNTCSKRTPNIVKQQLKSLGLMGTNSHTKFIPNVYKYNTIEVRKALLCGLLDTDGYASSSNLVQYTTVSKQLCEDVRFLVESLGGIVHFTVKDCGYMGKITGVSYTLTIKFDAPQEYFMLTRKKELLTSRVFRPRRSIVKIDQIGFSDARCIAVDSPDHLYLADHFVVTHNTKQIIDLAVIRKHAMGFKHCLILCGVNSLKWNWLEEIGKHSNEVGHILGQSVSKRTGKLSVKGNPEKTADLDRLLDGDTEFPYFIITNIESLRNNAIATKLKQLCDNGTVNMVAFDECHRAKCLTTQQGAGLLQIQPDYRIAMTGTPLINTPLDLFAILKWLGYEPYEFGQFKYHFCEIDEFGNIAGYKNIDQLREQLNAIMLRRTKKEVLDLPEKVYVNEYVELTTEQKSLYNQVIDRAIEDPEFADVKISDCLLAVKMRLRQVSSGIGPFGKIAVNPKLDRMEQIVEEAVYSGTKAIVFSNWVKEINPAVERLEKYNPLVITGETKDADRQAIVNRFQTDNSVKVICCTIGAAGVGITLTAATEVIFLSEPWTNADKEQAIDRCHRIGTKYNITIHTIMGHGTYDEEVHNIVLGKKALSDTFVERKDMRKWKIS